MMETSTFPGSSERRIVQSPLSACPRSAVASPNTAPPTIRISPITRLKFMVLLPFPALLGFLENSRLLEGDQFVERQVLEAVLARFVDEFRRDPLDFCADEFIHVQVFESRILHELYVLRRNALHFHSDRSEEHTSELQSLTNLVCRLLLEK